MNIVTALDEMHSSVVLTMLVFLYEVAVGVGESDERDQSAPAKTAPQQAGFGSYWASWCWPSVPLVVVLGGDMGYSSGFLKGIRHAGSISAS